MPKNIQNKRLKHSCSKPLKLFSLEISFLIKSASTVDLKKRFPLKGFLNQFSVPNKERKKIKKQLIDVFLELGDSGLIENEVRLTSTRCSNIKIKDLTSSMVSKSESISFWEKF